MGNSEWDHSEDFSFCSCAAHSPLCLTKLLVLVSFSQGTSDPQYLGRTRICPALLPGPECPIWPFFSTSTLCFLQKEGWHMLTNIESMSFWLSICSFQQSYHLRLPAATLSLVFSLSYSLHVKGTWGLI